MDEDNEERLVAAVEGVAESLEYIAGTQVEILTEVSELRAGQAAIRAGQDAALPALAVIEQDAAKAEFDAKYEARKAAERPWWSNKTIQIVAAAIIAVAALITGVAKAEVVGEVVVVDHMIEKAQA